jgi:hypothetical protein
MIGRTLTRKPGKWRQRPQLCVYMLRENVSAAVTGLNIAEENPWLLLSISMNGDKFIGMLWTDIYFNQDDFMA